VESGLCHHSNSRPNLLAHKRGEAAKSSNLTLPHQTCSRSQLPSSTTVSSKGMDEEYILRWNDHGVSFFALAEDLLQQELLTDVTVWCGDRVFDAHRLVLSACSPLFKSMLTRQPPRLRRSPDHTPIVFLRDVSPVHFERLLQFMYCGEVRVPNNELEDLLSTATSLSVRGLANAHERTCNNAASATSAEIPLLTNNQFVSSNVSVPPAPPAPPPPSAVPPVVATASEPTEVINDTPKPVQNVREPCVPATPPKKRRLSRDSDHHHKKSPLSTLDNNRLLRPTALPVDSAPLPLPLPPPPPLHTRGYQEDIKEEDEPVSPPPQAEMVPLVEPTSLKATSTLLAATVAATASEVTAASRISETQRILPPSEPRKTGTCYFCKKSFMKNKQLMNHVCPKKPRGGGGNNSSGSAASSSTTSFSVSKAPSPT